jgi:hypothetical protein
LRDEANPRDRPLAWSESIGGLLRGIGEAFIVALVLELLVDPRLKTLLVEEIINEPPGRIAMAGAGADRLGEVSLSVHAIARDPRAKLDSIAGYTLRPRYFFGTHPNTQGPGGSDGSGGRP